MPEAESSDAHPGYMSAWAARYRTKADHIGVQHPAPTSPLHFKRERCRVLGMVFDGTGCSGPARRV